MSFRKARLFKLFSESYQKFQPEAHGLRPDFILTNFAKLKGCGCKLDHKSLLSLINELDNKIMLDSPDCSFDRVTDDLAIVSTLDFFYPLVDDPYFQGKIAAANVLSDLYAAGVTEVRNSLMILGISIQMTKEEQKISTSMILKGYAEKVEEAGAHVAGGQTVYNEWPTMGGAAIGVVRGTDPFIPRKAQPGDQLVLTKPLGAQIVVNVNQWRKNNDDRWLELQKITTEDTVERAYSMAVEQMATLNRTAAEIMLECNATSSTDVTGFGILGHAENIAEVQNSKVDFVIESLPVYKGMIELDNIVRDFNLIRGRTPETSGGLLISLPAGEVETFISRMRESGHEVWRVGEVVEGNNSARMSESLDIVHV